MRGVTREALLINAAATEGEAIPGRSNMSSAQGDEKSRSFRSKAVRGLRWKMSPLNLQAVHF
jgi:hypothetical protein